jgi:hypothetical protein
MPIDMSLAGAAPPKTARRQSQAAPRKTQTDSRAEAVNGLFQLGSFGSVMIGNYADAATLAEHGPGISTEVANLARENEQIGKWIDYLTQAGPYAGLITAVLPMALQLLANHKRIDHTKVPGLTDPRVLETKIQTQMKAAAVQQMQAAQTEQRRYDEAIAQMEASMQNGQPQE